MSGNYEEVLKTIIDLLEHVKIVEKEIQEETKKRSIDLSSFLEKHKITPDVEVLEGIQYQDILSQKLSATQEAMDLICKNLQRYLVAIDSDSSVLKDSISSLGDKLKKSLDNAKEKQKAFNLGFPKFKDSKLENQSFTWNNQGFQIIEKNKKQAESLRYRSLGRRPKLVVIPIV